MLAFLGAHKAVSLSIAVALLIVGTLYGVNRIYGKGEGAGAAKVTTAVQGEVIRRTEEARQDKVKAEEAVRQKPIDDVVDSLK